MAKTPFEKVRSLVERRKLFEALLEEKTEILCKGDDESLFNFRPLVLAGGSVVQGWIVAIEKAPLNDTNILGNFAVGSEKFFFQAPMKVTQTEGSFPVNTSVYRLQRRASVRLQVHPSYNMYLALTEFQGKNIYSIAQISDISAGGARIFFSEFQAPIPAMGTAKNPGLRLGDQFKCVLHTGNHKNMELWGEVKHVQKASFHDEMIDHYGIEFVNANQSLKNRLVSMTMDLQRRMVREDF